MRDKTELCKQTQETCWPNCVYHGSCHREAMFHSSAMSAEEASNCMETSEVIAILSKLADMHDAEATVRLALATAIDYVRRETEQC